MSSRRRSYLCLILNKTEFKTHFLVSLDFSCKAERQSITWYVVKADDAVFGLFSLSSFWCNQASFAFLHTYCSSRPWKQAAVKRIHRSSGMKIPSITVKVESDKLESNREVDESTSKPCTVCGCSWTRASRSKTWWIHRSGHHPWKKWSSRPATFIQGRVHGIKHNY